MDPDDRRHEEREDPWDYLCETADDDEDLWDEEDP